MSVTKYLNARLNLKNESLNQIITLLSSIDGIKPSWESNHTLTPSVIIEMRRNNIVTSAASSNRIENIVLTDSEVSKLLITNKKDNFKRNEAEVVGYMELLNLIFEDYQSIEIISGNILNIHNQLLKYSDPSRRYRGRYKLMDNEIALASQSGEILGTLFKPTSAELVNSEIQELLDWLVSQSKEARVHPLILTAVFILEFLAIHPFDDGNGRISRVLSVLMLLQNGYEFAKYTSHEKVIEKTRDGYYLTLRTAQKNWRTEQEDTSDWIIYFLETVLSQAKDGAKLFNANTLENGFETNLSPKQQLIWGAAKELRDFGRKDIEEMTKLPTATINQGLNKFLELGKLERMGFGSGVRYRVKR